MRAAQDRLDLLQEQMKKQKYSTFQKIVFIALFCFAIVLIGAYVAYLLDSKYFLLQYDVIENETAASIICCGLFLANMFLFSYFSTNASVKQCLIFALCYIPIYFISNELFLGTLIFSMIIPIATVIIFSLIVSRDKLLIVMIRIFIFWTFITIYQYFSFAIKFNTFTQLIHNYEISVMSKLFFSLDSYIFMFCMACFKGGEYNGWWMELNVRTKAIGNPVHDHEDLAAIAQFNALSKGRRIKAIVLLAAFQVFQMFFILFVCKIGNVFIESAIMMLSFLLSGMVIKNRWHSPNIIVCTLTSAAIFYIASRAIVPARISMFLPVIIGILIAYSLYLVAIHTHDYNALKAYKQAREAFNAKSRRGKAKAVLETLPASHVDFNMLQDYANGETLEILADKYNLSLSTLNRKINALVRK